MKVKTIGIGSLVKHLTTLDWGVVTAHCGGNANRVEVRWITNGWNDPWNITIEPLNDIKIVEKK